MKITEKRLRSIISEVIGDMSHVMSQAGEHMQGVGHDMRRFMDKALSCCSMSADKLFNMCAKICAGNADQARHCAEVCAQYCGC